MQPDPMADSGAGPDAGVAADVDPAAHGRSSAHVDVITDDDMVPDHGMAVDPAATANSAAGADPGACLDIGSCTDIGVRFRQDAGPEQTPAVGVPVVGGGLAGVVFDDLDVSSHSIPFWRARAPKKINAGAPE
jgi:hypothetical protein